MMDAQKYLWSAGLSSARGLSLAAQGSQEKELMFTEELLSTTLCAAWCTSNTPKMYYSVPFPPCALPTPGRPLPLTGVEFTSPIPLKSPVEFSFDLGLCPSLPCCTPGAPFPSPGPSHRPSYLCEKAQPYSLLAPAYPQVSIQTGGFRGISANGVRAPGTSSSLFP
jgi:hypothetical protein